MDRPSPPHESQQSPEQSPQEPPEQSPQEPPEQPSGVQHQLHHEGPRGLVTAVVTELAASLRALRVGEQALIHEYPADMMPPWGSGIVMVPWPNRVAGARWRLDGVEQRLDVTEPATGNANHGLLRNTGYSVVEQDAAAVTLAATVFPQHGYPFHLRTAVRYQLLDDGLRVTHTLRNTGTGTGTAPVALGTHPYLRVGDVPVSDLVLRVDADRQLEVDERSIPVRTEPVTAALDLRGGRRVGDLHLDTAYTGLGLRDGHVVHRLEAPDGSATELWAEPAFTHVQVFTTRSYPGEREPELAVAVEPMTAPADALNSGEGLRWLAPGETWSAAWGVRHLR